MKIKQASKQAFTGRTSRHEQSGYWSEQTGKSRQARVVKLLIIMRWIFTGLCVDDCLGNTSGSNTDTIHVTGTLKLAHIHCTYRYAHADKRSWYVHSIKLGTHARIALFQQTFVLTQTLTHTYAFKHAYTLNIIYIDACYRHRRTFIHISLALHWNGYTFCRLHYPP